MMDKTTETDHPTTTITTTKRISEKITTTMAAMIQRRMKITMTGRMRMSTWILTGKQEVNRDKKIISFLKCIFAVIPHVRRWVCRSVGIFLKRGQVLLPFSYRITCFVSFFEEIHYKELKCVTVDAPFFNLLSSLKTNRRDID